MASRYEGDLIVTGNLMAGTMDLPANSVGDDQVRATQPITCAKLNHQYQPLYSQPRASTVVTGREVIHVANAVGEIISVQALLTDLALVGAATIVVKVYKNGVDITGTPATLTNADALYTGVQDATLSSVDYVAGDVFEVDVVATAGGGTVGKGLVVRIVFREAAE
jgi:hypothetical protein